MNSVILLHSLCALGLLGVDSIDRSSPSAISLIDDASSARIAWRNRNSPFLTQSNGVFKIIHFTDLHYDERPDTKWGPAQDILSTRVMETVLQNEDSELVIFGGDQITQWRKNATEYWDVVMAPVIRHKRKYAMIFGNHDDCDQPYTKPPPNDVTRRQKLLVYDMLHSDYSFTLSFFQSKMGGGVTNYFHKVYLSEEESERDSPTGIMWFLDSGGGSLEEIVREDQIEWFEQETRVLKRLHGDLPALLFMHIPTVDFAEYNPQALGGRARCTGIMRDQINTQKKDTGVFEAAAFANVSHIFVGHNHGNTFCCPKAVDSFRSIELCYGGHAGYGGYGNWERGSRIINWDLNKKTKDSSRIKYYFRMEDGSVQEA